MEPETSKASGWDNLPYAALCACLKKAVHDNGLTVRELTGMLDKRYATIVNLLNGKLPNPTLDTIESVCEALGLSLSFNLQPSNRRKPGRQPGKKGNAALADKSPGE